MSGCFANNYHYTDVIYAYRYSIDHNNSFTVKKKPEKCGPKGNSITKFLTKHVAGAQTQETIKKLRNR